MIKISQRGNFKRTEGYLKRLLNSNYKSLLNKAGQDGVMALAAATPVNSGETANSWSYYIEYGRNRARIVWTNTHTTPSGTPIAVLIQYGHATGTGAYVPGMDFINPALAPIIRRLSQEIYREVAR